MIRRRVFVLLLAGALAAGGIAFLPAKAIEARVSEALAPTARLVASGTIWNGGGSLELLRGGEVLSIPVTWRFEPAWLLRLRFGWQLTAASPLAEGKASVGLGAGSLQLRDTDLATDARLWHRLSPAAMLVGAGGRYAWKVSGNDFWTIGLGEVPQIAGQAQLSAADFALNSWAPQALGTYVLRLTGEDSVVRYTFLPSPGALQFDGGGAIGLTAPRTFTYKGLAKMSADLPPPVAASVKAAGSAQSDGRVVIELNRNW